MKRHYTILYLRAMVALLLATLVSCSGNGFPFSVDDEDNPTPVAETLSVDQTDMSFKAEGESKTLRITSNTTWIITCDATWLIPSQNEGFGNASVTLMVKENSDTKERTAKLTVSGASTTFTIKVSQEGGGGSITPTPSGSGNGTADSPYNVAGAQTAGSGTGVYVKAYIVGNVEGQVLATGAKFGTDGDSQTNILIAASPDETNVDNCMPVQLPTGDIRTAINLKDNPGNYKKDVTLYGNIEKYFGATGLKSVTFAILNGKEIGTKPGGSDPLVPTGDKGTLQKPFNAAEANAYAGALSAGAESDKDVYIKGKIISITDKNQFNTQYGNCTFYISNDGTESDDKFYVFRTLYLGNKKYTEGILPKAGDEVIICGRVTNYQGNTPETAANKSYIYSLNGRTSVNEESPAPAGPVAYYPFNGNANDESGNGNHGTVIGHVELAPDRFGNSNSAYRFFGEPMNYISIPDDESLHLSTFTLNAWVYTDAEDYSHGILINKGRDIDNGSYRLTVKSVGATNLYGGVNDAFVEDIPETKIWHMVTGTIEGDKAKFYLDAVLVDEKTLSNPFEYANTEPLSLGMHYFRDVPSYWAYPLMGVLDDVRIYNRVLTESEIMALYSISLDM